MRSRAWSPHDGGGRTPACRHPVAVTRVALAAGGLPSEHDVVSGRAPYRDERVNKVRTALVRAGTNLHHVSEITRQPPYGDRTNFAIPHWFYSELEHGGTPHICQVIALSQITGYRFVDWMSLFGYRLDDIPRLQASLPREESLPLSAVTYDKDAPVECRDTGSISDDALEETQPLSDVLGAQYVTTVGALERARDGKYLYVKMGDADDSLYPRIGAGSIVRIDTERTQLGAPGQAARVLAVHWNNRLLLTFLKPVAGKPGIVVLPPRYPALEQGVGRDMTIVGTADGELRLLRDEPVSKSLRRVRQVASSPSRDTGITARADLRRYRERAGLNLRQVHALTVNVSELTGDASYVVSQSCLFRCELGNALPRHISKIISLCIVYGVSLWEILHGAGIQIVPDAGRRMSDSPEADTTAREHVGTTQVIDCRPWTKMLTDVPLFLREVVPALLGQRQISLETVYTCGAALRANNPMFQGAILLTVDPRQRNVERVKAQARYREPMFLLRSPSGQYLSGACSVQNGTLTVQPRLQTPTVLARFARAEVEVLGRITGVVRLLDPESEAGFPPRSRAAAVQPAAEPAAPTQRLP
jgi:hypothetical protein